ncbi:MAG TPA: KH domain-containing protein [Chloroflexota bacterium]|jgi:predicted RNA-binding protein YlqC (UPF0109 family)|nr:KH domain-containing protein [Chloroflexota bacterium]
MRDLIVYVAQQLVAHPDQVRVTEIDERTYTVYQLQVAPEDVGKVIGRDGRIANALRVLIKTSAARNNRRAILEIV